MSSLPPGAFDIVTPRGPSHRLGQSLDVQWNLTIKHSTIKVSTGTITAYNYKRFCIL